MPLTRDVSANIRELTRENLRRARGLSRKGPPRSRKQIIAIALRAAGKSRTRYRGSSARA